MERGSGSQAEPRAAPTLDARPIGDELWREYDFGGRVYRIDEPVELILRPGGSTHRVLGADGVVHCVPAPGVAGCVLRWRPRPGKAPVAF